VELSRAVDDSMRRVRAGAWGAGQCALASAGAWAFSANVLGHPRPFFASVAAVVSLGLTGGGRLRRTAELSAGVALGVAVGDLLVGLIGQGPWQIGVVVFVALLLAVAVGGRGLVVSQSGLQAVFVVALPRLPHSGLHRWQDAVVGGTAALLVAALLPQDPWRMARRLRAAYVAELAAVLRDTSAGARAGSTAEVADALARARALEPVLNRWVEALAIGRDTARLTPFRHDRGAAWAEGLRLTTGFGRASRNLRVLVRRVLVAVEGEQPLPAGLVDLLDELADAVARSGSSDEAVGPLVVLAGRLDPVALGAAGLTAQVVVAQLRVAVVDLLDGLGLEQDRARNALPELS
jgi:uncharacterized membrane protein YgaE (UPF0421/DUF939 family)